MIGFEISQVIIDSKFENYNLFQQLGHSGPNVLDHVFHHDDEFALSDTAVMDSNLKKGNVRIVKIRSYRAFNQYRISCLKGFNTVPC